MALASAACSNATAELGRLIKLLLGHRKCPLSSCFVQPSFDSVSLGFRCLIGAALTMMPAEPVPSLALMVLVYLVVSSALWLHGMPACPSTCWHFISCLQSNCRCPIAFPLRCWDGSCVSNSSSCAGDPGCPSATVRSEDGACRSVPLPFDGCHLSSPFFCDGRAISCVASAAACTPSMSHVFRSCAFSVSELALQLSYL